MGNKASVLLLLGMLSGYASAQSSSSMAIDSCTALAKVIATTYQDKLTMRERRAMEHNITCTAAESKSTEGFQITAGAFGVSGNQGETTVTPICSSSQAQSQFTDVEYDRAKSVFEPALKTIDACLNAAQSGWKLDPQISSDAIVLTVENSNVRGGRLLGIIPLPQSVLTCTPARQLPTNVLPSNPYTTVCTRIPRQAVVDGVATKEADDATLVVQLSNGGSVSLPLPGYSASPMRAMNMRVAELETKLNALKRSLGTWDKPIDGPMTTQGGDTTSASSCPDGAYVSSVTARGSGTRNCHGCVNAVQVTCRKIKTE